MGISESVWTIPQQNYRDKLADSSPEIRIRSTTDIHNTATYLKSQAFVEKLNKYKLREPTPNRMQELEALRQKHLQKEKRFGLAAASDSSAMDVDVNQLNDQSEGGFNFIHYTKPTNQHTNARPKIRASISDALTSSRKPHSSSSITMTSSASSDSFNIGTPPPRQRTRSTQKPRTVSNTPSASTRSTTVVNVMTPPPVSLDKGKGREIISSPVSTRSQSSVPMNASSSALKSPLPYVDIKPSPYKRARHWLVLEESEDEDEREWEPEQGHESLSPLGVDEALEKSVLTRKKRPRRSDPAVRT